MIDIRTLTRYLRGKPACAASLFEEHLSYSVSYMHSIIVLIILAVSPALMASDGIFPDVKTMLTAPDDSLYKIAWPAYPDVKIMQTRAMEIYFQIAWYNLSSAKISILIKYQFYPPPK